MINFLFSRPMYGIRNLTYVMLIILNVIAIAGLFYPNVYFVSSKILNNSPKLFYSLLDHNRLNQYYNKW